jgi:hypothetical protein
VTQSAAKNVSARPARRDEHGGFRCARGDGFERLKLL